MSEQTLPESNDVYKHKTDHDEVEVIGTVQSEQPVNSYYYMYETAVLFKRHGILYAKTLRRFINQFDFIRRK